MNLNGRGIAKEVQAVELHWATSYREATSDQNYENIDNCK